jgi:hypothetical protein
MTLEIPDLKGKELFKFLLANEKTLIAQKKFEIKRGDAITYAGPVETSTGRVTKAGTGSLTGKTELDVTSVINTTYWYDSHGDVHIDGLWKKSLSENKGLYLLQEHSLTFKGIISDEVRAYTKAISWRELGVNVEGFTEALVFDSKVKQARNSYMFEQYRDGNVKNHSVGMRYVRLDLAVNDEDYPAYKALWDKYIDKIANRDEVEEAGYFWPVLEAKVVEGSAVPIGSNPITPTESVKNIAPPSGTQDRAAKSTRVLDELTKLLNTVKSVQ